MRTVVKVESVDTSEALSRRSGMIATDASVEAMSLHLIGDSPEWRSVKGFMAKKLPDRQGYAYELQPTALAAKDNEKCLQR